MDDARARGHRGGRGGVGWGEWGWGGGGRERGGGGRVGRESGPTDDAHDEEDRYGWNDGTMGRWNE